MHYLTNSAIVLRKVAGRFEACWSKSGRVAGAGSPAAVPSIALLAIAFVLMLIPLAVVAGAAVLAMKAAAVTGLALATVPVASAQSIKEEILKAFEEFKNANDERHKQLATKGEVSAEVDAKVDRINDAISNMQAQVTRLTVGSPAAAAESELDAATKKKLLDFFAPSEQEREKKATITLALRSTREIKAAQGVGTAGGGGAIVAPSFSNRLEKALLFFSGMMQNSEVVTTESGVDLPWPTVNDTTQLGAILAENATITAQDVAFSSVTLKAYKYTSKLIAVSWELLQDAAFDVEGLVADLAGERLGRILNNHFTVGTGTAQPNGAVTAATAGKVGIAGQTLTVIYDDLIDLIHSVDVAYRIGSKFQLADSSLKVIRKIKDSQGRPLWEPSVQAGVPDTILGYPVIVNNDVPAMAVSAKSILFGDHSKYKIRRVRDVTMVRLNERYADNLQTGFFAYARFDGNLINAGTNPLKYYQNSAT